MPGNFPGRANCPRSLHNSNLIQQLRSLVLLRSSDVLHRDSIRPIAGCSPIGVRARLGIGKIRQTDQLNLNLRGVSSSKRPVGGQQFCRSPRDSKSSPLAPMAPQLAAPPSMTCSMSRRSRFRKVSVASYPPWMPSAGAPSLALVSAFFQLNRLALADCVAGAEASPTPRGSASAAGGQS
jgi:hypothetical protein